MNSIGVGVVGAGFMGEMHARIYHDLPNTHLVGIFDVDSLRSRNLAETLETKTFSDLASLMESPDIEAVSICVSDDSHLEPALSACRAGKHILLVEKRGHIGGNCFDSFDSADILIHNYGPHIFHTNYKEVWDYLSQFTEWLPYQHQVFQPHIAAAVRAPRTVQWACGAATTC